MGARSRSASLLHGISQARAEASMVAWTGAAEIDMSGVCLQARRRLRRPHPNTAGWGGAAGPRAVIAISSSSIAVRLHSGQVLAFDSHS